MASEGATSARRVRQDPTERRRQLIERRHEPYIALFRTAGTDDWVHEILRETRAALVDQVLDTLAVEEPSELLRAAIGSWLAFAEELSLEWARHRAGTRDEVRALLTGALRSVVHLAQERR